MAFTIMFLISLMIIWFATLRLDQFRLSILKTLKLKCTSLAIVGTFSLTTYSNWLRGQSTKLLGRFNGVKVRALL